MRGAEEDEKRREGRGRSLQDIENTLCFQHSLATKIHLSARGEGAERDVSLKRFIKRARAKEEEEEEEGRRERGEEGKRRRER